MSICKVGKIKAINYKRLSSGVIKKENRITNPIKLCIEYVEDTKDLTIEQREFLAEDNFNTYEDDFDTYTKIVNYAENTNKCFDKDSNKMLITGLNTNSAFNAAKEFIECERFYHSHKAENVRGNAIPNEAFHIIQSFKGKDVPAEKVHKIGLEFAERLVGTDYKTIITTHNNTDNNHNHIVVCAYNIDGYHKYRDAWKLGLKLQKLNDEISLENGIEIITEIVPEGQFELFENNFNEDKISLNTHEYKANKKHSLDKKTLANDIILSAKSSENWEQFVEQMNHKGYELKQNKNSITYIKSNLIANAKAKDIAAMRDNRLGKQYTKAALIRYFNNKKNNILNNEFYDSNIKIQLKPSDIIPNKFIGSGRETRQNPLLFRFIELLLNILKLIVLSPSSPSELAHKKDTKSSQFVFAERTRYLNQIKAYTKHLTKIQELLLKYNINNISSLQTKKQILLRNYTKLKNQKETLSKKVYEYNKIKDAYNSVINLENFIIEKGIKEKDLLLYDESPSSILENNAKIDPMYPKTKSRLYKALHNSGYKLKYNFNQLTEKQAKDIIYFLAEINKKNFKAEKPNTLYTMTEYVKLRDANKFPKIEYTKSSVYNSINQKLKKTFKDFSDNDFKTLLSYKNAKQYLKSHGFNTIIEAEKFIETEIKPTEKMLEDLEQNLLEQKELLSDFNSLDSFFDGSYKYNFKPFQFIDNVDVIDSEINKFNNENETLKEQLITIKTLINDEMFNDMINTLDDNTIIIAPAEIIALTKSILTCQGNDIDTKDLLKLTKQELKEIIVDFVNKFDIDKALKNELKSEVELELLKQNKEQQRKDQKEQLENQRHIIDNIIKNITK